MELIISIALPWNTAFLPAVQSSLLWHNSMSLFHSFIYIKNSSMFRLNDSVSVCVCVCMCVQFSRWAQQCKPHLLASDLPNSYSALFQARVYSINLKVIAKWLQKLIKAHAIRHLLHARANVWESYSVKTSVKLFWYKADIRTDLWPLLFKAACQRHKEPSLDFPLWQCAPSWEGYVILWCLGICLFTLQ